MLYICVSTYYLSCSFYLYHRTQPDKKVYLVLLVAECMRVLVFKIYTRFGTKTGVRFTKLSRDWWISALYAFLGQTSSYFLSTKMTVARLFLTVTPPTNGRCDLSLGD